MAWQGRIHKDRNVVIYRNGPPTGAGGAVKVIEDLPVKVWVSPETDKDHPPIPNKEWASMRDREKGQLTEIERDGYRCFTFRVPHYLQDAQYNMIANGLIWPIFHSTDASALDEPHKLSEKGHKRSFNFKYVDAQGRPRDPEEDYQHYKEFNQLGGNALKKLQRQGIIADSDLRWVHDYQCVNVPGDIYTQHIPFPPLDYLRKITINGQRMPLLACNFFRDFVKQMANHGLITFQRPIDMKNFIEVAAALDPEFKKLNSQFLNEHGMVPHDFAIGAAVKLHLFGKETKLMNIPVGLDKDAALNEARSVTSDGIDITLAHSTYETSTLDKAGIAYDRGQVFRERTKDGREIEKVRLKDLLPIRNILDPTGEHRIFLAAHRNDYSKSTLEKLFAAGSFLGSLSKEERRHVHFLFFLQPTRTNVPGYNTYTQDVERTVEGLRKKFGDSIIVIPDQVDHRDYLGLMRHRNTTALLGIALKDGHDLTLREAASVRADFDAPGDPRAAMAIVTTDGTGASDILGGTKEKPGAFVIDKIETFQQMVKKLHEQFGEINDLAKTPEGKVTLANRYQVAAAASQQYSPEHFKEKILEAAQGQGRTMPGS